MANEFDGLVKKRIAFINENKEKLIQAWIAETGVMPSDAVLMQQDMGNGTTRFFVTRKDGDSLIEQDLHARVNILDRELRAARKVVEAVVGAANKFDWSHDGRLLGVSREDAKRLWEALKEYDEAVK